MRREWIEIDETYLSATNESKSPSMRREWIEMYVFLSVGLLRRSPSMRREWIEILLLLVQRNMRYVSLHAEGVD